MKNLSPEERWAKIAYFYKKKNGWKGNGFIHAFLFLKKRASLGNVLVIIYDTLKEQYLVVTSDNYFEKYKNDITYEFIAQSFTL